MNPDQQATNPSQALGPTLVPYHLHTGQDAPLLPFNNVAGMFSMVTTTPTWTPNGVANSIALNSTTGQIYYYDTTNKVWKSTISISSVAYGGTGADGALSITSGTTTISLGNAPVVIKNYTSISITGTGALAFSNAAVGGSVVLLLSQGNITISSSANPTIDMRGLGGTGANGGSGGGSGLDGSNGTSGAAYTAISDGLTHNGQLGAKGVNKSSGTATGGAAGAATTAWSVTYRGRLIGPGQAGGSGGGGGGGGNSVGGNGGNAGNGAGSLVLEAAGNISITSIINLSGGDATVGGNTGDGVNNFNQGGGGGGGGGGSAGTLGCYYVGTYSNSGTLLQTGGLGKAGGTVALGPTGGSANNFGSGGGGGSGGASVGAGGGAGTNGTDNSGGSTPNGGAGGNGASGEVIAVQLA